MKHTLLLTAAVNAVRRPDVALREAESRKTQYLEAVRYYIHEARVDGVVICDNSGYDFGRDVASLCSPIPVESLVFAGDGAMVASRGKGYGEACIVEYALRNARLLRGDCLMTKITGRIRIRNISDLLSPLRPDGTYFLRSSLLPRVSVDTRLFSIRPAVYLRHFMNIGNEVQDDHGYYLERAFAERIKRRSLLYRNYTTYPIYDGVSGSTGRRYNEAFWKISMKALLCRLDLYRPAGRGSSFLANPKR